jgi:hypothetical protein
VGSARPSRTTIATIGALVAWVALVVVAWRLGLPHRAEWKLRAAPLAGFVDRHVSVGTAVALIVGLALVRLLPRWAERTSWRRLLLGTVLLAAGWGALLGLTRGVDELGRGLAHRHEYPAIVPVVDQLGVREFIDTFTTQEALRDYPIHVQGHPVGAALLFVGLDRIGLGGAAAAAAFVVAIGSTAAAAVLIVVREVAGERWARRLAPFLALAPTAVWAVASADALFAAVGAWGIALLVLATADGRSPRSIALLAVAGGAVGGVGMQLSYGLPPVFLVAVGVVIARRRWPVLAWAAVGGAAVTGLAALAGFWWLDGLGATRIRYVNGISEFRPRDYFTFIGNPAALFLAVGPAVAVALVRVRDRRLWLVAGGAIAAVVVANASGLSKAEVERIWLPFATWLLVLTAGLPALAAPVVPGASLRRSLSPPWPRLASWLLAAQVLVAVAVESLVKTPW